MYKKITTLFLISFLSVASMAQPTAFTTCPNASTAVVRSGNNTSPYSIYNVNTTTGAVNLLSGPILDPASATTNLQVDGLGLNSADGFMYGLFSDAPALSLTPTTAFYRVGANAAALQLGTLSGPTPTGADNGSFVVPTAGVFNQSGTYYFSAITGFVLVNIFNLPASTFTPSTFYIGALAGANSLTSGTAALSPTFTAITNPSNDAIGYLSYSSTTISATSASSLGLQDMIFNTADGQLYTYVTYPNGTSGYFGQMLKVNPSTGVLSAVTPPTVQPFLTSTVYPIGLSIDNAGNFLVLMTNGAMYKADGTPGVYTGTLSLLSSTTGLPSGLNGDLASCGLNAVALPLPLSNFELIKENKSAIVSWESSDEKNIIQYNVEYSADGNNFETIETVIPAGKSTYSITHSDGLNIGTNYYRLRVNYINGANLYSQIKTINLSAEDINVYPNPAQNELNIQLKREMLGADVELNLYNQLGQAVFQTVVQNAENTIKLQLGDVNLSNGLYFLQMRVPSVSSTRLVKINISR